MPNVFLLFLVFLGFNLTHAQTSISNLEIPRLRKGESALRHSAFSFSYNEEYEQANWVAYELTSEETRPVVKRNNRFLEDPKVKTATATHTDYLHSNYDRGHLAPAADMCWSARSMQESFYYSNISPQEPTFNRGIWEELEEQVRDWAEQYGAVYVVTGPVLSAGLSAIGPNKVAVPRYFYKAVLDYRSEKRKAIAFLMPNAESQESLTRFVVSVDSLEKFTGIDFFPLLPDEEENLLEGRMGNRDWYWSHSKRSGSGMNISRKTAKSSVGAARCGAITKKGSRCKNKAKVGSGYCGVHG
jgi:endonuclease G